MRARCDSLPCMRFACATGEQLPSLRSCLCPCRCHCHCQCSCACRCPCLPHSPCSCPCRYPSPSHSPCSRPVAVPPFVILLVFVRVALPPLLILLVLVLVAILLLLLVVVVHGHVGGRIRDRGAYPVYKNVGEQRCSVWRCPAGICADCSLKHKFVSQSHLLVCYEKNWR